MKKELTSLEIADRIIRAVSGAISRMEGNRSLVG